MSPIFFIACVWKEAFLLYILSTIAELFLNIKPDNLSLIINAYLTLSEP
jgi:hypothetical protein